MPCSCGDDEPLRREVESLLANESKAAGFLSEPALDLAAKMMPESPGSSMAGQQIGAYQIVSLLGAGGMGEVYRARDTKLGRDVAIKILLRAFVTDPDRLIRFEREARMLATLNHPHIGAIYGVEESDGVRGLVLELVEGPTLADRIAGGSLPIAEVLAIARQIADALEAAHEKGIVHRDLKPANIKITPAGIVKVLDFGLAKLETPAGGSATLSQSPTVTVGGTRDGVILGTAAYMSPEQARGQAVDKRTDIWAFGCVLYELLTGRAVFAAATVSDSLARVLEREPDWQALPSATPEGIRALLRRCLQKDPAQRLHDIADARLELDETLGTASSTSGGRSWRLHRTRNFVGAGGLLAVLLMTTYYLATRESRAVPEQATALRATFTQVTAQPGTEWFPSLSPDGRWIVYGGENEGNRDIYLQSVNGQTAIDLTKDSQDDDDQPAFSPDGEQIAFRSTRDGGGIFVMGRTGEAVRRVTRAGFSPAWSPDGKRIAYATGNIDVNPQNAAGSSELWVMNADGGQARRIIERNAAMPSWSPHGQRIAYMSLTPSQLDIWTVTTTGGAPVAVTQDSWTDWNPVWAADGRYLYFASDRGGSMNLWRVAIDEATGHTLRGPEPITTPASSVAHLTVSADGRHMAYSSVQVTQNIQKLALESSGGVVAGEPAWRTTGSRRWSNPDLSVDRQWLVFYSRTQPEGDLYVMRADGTGLRQVTSDAAIDRVPRWSPDGKWIAFNSNRSGRQELWKIRPDGSDLQQLTDGADAGFPVWSPDGSRLAGTADITGDLGRVLILDPNRRASDQRPDQLPRQTGPAPAFIANSWSLDGDRLVGQAGNFASARDAGPLGIVVYSFQSRAFETLTDFGEWPIWLPDGQHILFVSGGNSFYIVDSRSKQIRKVYSAGRDVLGPAQLTRDGREAYFSRRVTESDVWMITLQ